MPVFNDYKGVKGSRLEDVVYDTAVEVQKLKQQQTAGANIKALDLAVGEPTSLTYDVDNGVSITKQGEVTATDNSKYNITVSDEIPLLPGNNINIDASEDGKHIVISSIGGGGSGVAGVSSFGGQTGDIRVGKHLSMSGTTVNADIQPTPVIIETLDDADASSGTLTDNQLSTLQSNTANPLVKRNEYYYLNDNEHTPGALGYTHLGYENGNWYTKNITITISTKGWVRKSSEIPDKTIIPFVSLSVVTAGYPVNGNFTVEQATKLISSPFSAITFTPYSSPVQIPLLLQPSETVHNSYVYSGHDDSYTYTVNATLSATSAGTWLAKSYVITRETYVAPVTTTIDGESGAFTLGANLHLENKIITGTNTVTTVNGHTGVVNIVAGSNVSVSDVGGTLTISATGGGGGTTTLPFISLGSGQTDYPITGEFTEEQGNKLLAAPFSTITFNPSGSPDQVPMLPQTSEQIHYSYIWKGSDANYTYTITATLNRTSDGSGGFVWISKSYTITREANGGGGGSSAALYQHNIETQCDPATYVYMTVYTSDNSPLTSLTPWQMKFGNDKVFGGGYVVYNNGIYPMLYTQADNEGVKSYYAGSGTTPTATYQWGGTGQWTDNVKEV